MDRRTILQLGGAALAAGALNGTLANSALAQAGKTLPLSVGSRALDWLTTPQTLAKAVQDIGSKSVDLTVRANSNHVDPAKARTEMPRWVKGLRANGVAVAIIDLAITDAGDPHAEEVLDAAAQLGIRHYGWRTDPHDESMPYRAQLEALKPKVEAITRLNEKYAMKAMLPLREGATGFFDLYYILKDFDPRRVSFQFDTNQLTQALEGGWMGQLRLGAPYMGGFVWKDVAGRSAASTIDLKRIAQTLKEIAFNGPMTWEPEWLPDRSASGLSIPRAHFITLMKRDRVTLDTLFADTRLV